MNTLIKVMLPLLVIGGSVGGYILLDTVKPEPEKKTEAARPLSVFVEPVIRGDMPLKVLTQGEVRARTELDIVAQVAGRIVSVSPEFTEGGVIEPGVALVVIEPTDYEFLLDQAEARLAEAEVQLQQIIAEADVARKQLRNADGASPLALKKPQVAEAEARLKAATSDLRQAQTNLARTKISLPFRGRMVTTEVDIGQFVTPGTRLGKAFGQDVVEVRVPISDMQLASLGLPIGYVAGAEDVLPVEISATVGGKQHKWSGSLTRLDASIDPTTRTLFGITQVIDPYGQGVSQFGMPLAVGLFVNAEITGDALRDVDIISRQALRAGNQVYVISKDGRLDIRDVEVAFSSTEEVVVARGVSPGEQVVVSSIRNAIQGMALETMYSPATAKNVDLDRNPVASNETELADQALDETAEMTEPAAAIGG